MRVKDSNTAWAIAFGRLIALVTGMSNLTAAWEDGLTATEVISLLLVTLGTGLLAGLIAYDVNRWLRKRGYGIGGDE